MSDKFSIECVVFYVVVFLHRNIWTNQPTFRLLSSHAENTVPIVHWEVVRSSLLAQVT